MTRSWESHNGSNTIVQFRDDTVPMVWLHTNIGWVPIGNAPKDAAKAERFAEEVAAGYGLAESPPERALWLAEATNDDEWSE